MGRGTGILTYDGMLLHPGGLRLPTLFWQSSGLQFRPLAVAHSCGAVAELHRLPEHPAAGFKLLVAPAKQTLERLKRHLVRNL